MSRVVFWDVDTQYDFIYPDGRLYVKGAEDIIPNLERLTGYAQKHGIQVIGSVDYHSESDEEISRDPDYQETFPVHCMKGTPGQSKIEATRPKNPLWIDYTKYGEEELVRKVKAHRGEIYFRKQKFDV
ncbi:MAG: cysteine hydrolase family protein, partial [Nitrososphaerales archaeon]